MKNAFVRFGYTCASLLIAGGLTTIAANADIHDIAYVTLPSSIEVGSTTLPGGRYTIASVSDNVYMLRSDKGDGAFVFGREVENTNASPKTEVVLKSDGEALRLDKLYLGGDTTGYEFRP